MQFSKVFKFHKYLVLFSIFCFLNGIFIGTCRIRFFNFMVNVFFTLKDSGMLYGYWIESQAPIPFDVYIFNWTNYKDSSNFSIKPIFEEVGPYRFNMDFKRVDVVFHDNDTVSFNYTKVFIFDRNNSVGSIDDIVVTANPLAATALRQTKYWSFFARKSFSFALSFMATEIYSIATVGQLVFNGYDDELLDMANTFPALNKGRPKMEKFAWFGGLNDSALYEGRYNMGTGNTHPFGLIYNWNELNRSMQYEGKCSEIAGSGLDSFQPFAEKKVGAYFNPYFCRSVVVDYVKESDYFGIDAYEYTLDRSAFDNGTYVPGNECYCTGECLSYGVMNTSSCKYGLPIFMSLPHLYKADESYFEDIEGLNPDPEKHSLDVLAQPRLGLILQFKLRIQINILFEPVSGISLYKGPRRLLPILWLKQDMVLAPSSVLPIRLLLAMPIVSLTLAALLFCTSIGCVTLAIIKTRKYEENCRNKQDCLLNQKKPYQF